MGGGGLKRGPLSREELPGSSRIGTGCERWLLGDKGRGDTGGERSKAKTRPWEVGGSILTAFGLSGQEKRVANSNEDDDDDGGGGRIREWNASGVSVCPKL